jgi:2-C-methyl-D-erythritol 2,4-cyclodiphosphate synthase
VNLVLPAATMLAVGRQPHREAALRAGIGYDIHRFGTEGVLVLGGVHIDDQPRLVGHSDGDPVMHAVADAILGAAGLGDIGEHFPTTDPRWEGADSASILARAVELAAQHRNLSPVNVDVNVVAQRPRLGAHKAAMRERVAQIVALPFESVSIKARTAEGLGPVGAGEAIEVHAVVLMDSRETTPTPPGTEHHPGPVNTR